MAALSDTPSRMFGLVCVLIVVWVVVYWIYQPAGAVAPAPAGAASNLTTIDTRPPVVHPPADPPATAPALTPPEPQPQPAPVADPPPPPVPRERVVPPRFRQIVVRQGDTSFEIIAARELGDRRKWALIARANPFVTSDRLKPGRTVLNIPLDPTNIQGKVVVDAGDGSPAAPSTAKPPEAAIQTYIVQPDDTLWEISRRVYKRGAAWRTIYEANRDVIKNPDRPPPGAVLKIPPAPPKE